MNERDLEFDGFIRSVIYDYENSIVAEDSDESFEELMDKMKESKNEK